MTHIVVMGVSGAGKTTLGRALAESLGWAFQEGDDVHPRANVLKMRSGHPLNDADRAPWLAAIRDVIDTNRAAGRSAVISCSALKRRYREQLGGGAVDVLFVHLNADRAVLNARLTQRTGHYMPAALLDSQIATLEPPLNDEALLLDAALPTDAQVMQVRARLAAMRGH